MDENISLEIAANLLHLFKEDENGEKHLDDERVATVLADSVAAVFGDFNQDDPEMSGNLEEMNRGINVLEKALQQYETLVQMVELQMAKRDLGVS